jgi:tetratricopeptide (TPR) repeat protein
MEALRTSLERILADESTASDPDSPGASLPLDLREKLAALGYVGGPGAAGAADPGADPKDKIDDYRIATDLMQRGLLRLNEGDFAGSVELLQDLLGRGVRSFELHSYLARGLLGLKKHQEAAAQFEKAVALDPGYPAGWEGLADCRIALGDLPGAVEAIRSAQENSPPDARLYRREARLWRQLGDGEKARRAYESALPLAPDDALLRVRLGELLRDMGEVEEAIRRLREAVELDPERASYWNSLGMVLGAHGHLPEAERAFRRAWDRDDSNPRHAFNTGLALLRLGRPEEARGFFEATLELDPGFEPARLHLAQIGP